MLLDNPSSFVPRHNIKPITVLFVCSKNYFRSPMAEAAMQATLERHPELRPLVGYVDSAGLEHSSIIGGPPHPETMQTLRSHGIHYSHVSRVIKSEDFLKFTYMYCMEREHVERLIAMRQDAAHRLRADWRSLSKIALFGIYARKPVRRPPLKLHPQYGEFLSKEIVDHSYYRERDMLSSFEIAYQQCKQYAQGFVEQTLEPLATRGRRW